MGVSSTVGRVRVLSAQLQLPSDKSNLGCYQFFNCSFVSVFENRHFLLKRQSETLNTTLNTVLFTLSMLCLLVLSPKYILISATRHSLLRPSSHHFSPG